MGRRATTDAVNTDDERAALHTAIAGAIPLRDAGRVAPEILNPAKARPHRRRHEELTDNADEYLHVLHTSDPGDTDAFLRNGVQRKLLRDLRRGRWAIESRLDLHGLNRQQAQAQISRFLAAALSAGQRCVCIVHGRGYGSPDQESVLRPLVKNWLAQYDAVLAFCHAAPSDGGDGALWVYLKTHN